MVPVAGVSPLLLLSLRHQRPCSRLGSRKPACLPAGLPARMTTMCSARDSGSLWQPSMCGALSQPAGPALPLALLLVSLVASRAGGAGAGEQRGSTSAACA